MRHPQSIAALVLLLLAPSALAQRGDWQAVKDIPSGTTISVKYGRFFIHMRCIFQSASDDRLVCARILYGPSAVFIPPEAVYVRKQIREVRLEHSDASNMAVGAAIGAGVGGALGAAGRGDTRTRVAAGLLVGGVGAVVGGLLGRDFPIRHGKVVYRR
jgi:hypothetical protein